MKRREVVRALFTPAPPDAADSPAAPEATRPRAAAGAVRAMGIEITRLAEEAREAAALRQRIEEGAAIVELSPALIDPSFIADRLARTADAEYRRLVESIRELGQQVPILVRPHPAEEGRYQIAYGHRRCAAAAELGRTVRAIVRPLDDAALVIAQGQENGARRALSFIERALFAAALRARGFDRATLNGALGGHTAEVTRLLAVASAIPRDLIGRIGPAPKAGRQRWLELARICAEPGGAEAVAGLLAQPAFAALPSDRRFAALIAALRQRAQAPVPRMDKVDILTDSAGQPILRLERLPGGLRATVDEVAAPGLSAMLARELHRLAGRYKAGHR